MYDPSEIPPPTTLLANFQALICHAFITRRFLERGDATQAGPSTLISGSAAGHCLAIRSPRAFLTKVRAFQPFTPVFAHDSGESARVGVPHPEFCAQFRRKCARRGSYCGASGAFAPDSCPDGLFWNASGAFSPKTRPVRGQSPLKRGSGAAYPPVKKPLTPQ